MALPQLSLPQRLVFIRHGQAEHNAERDRARARTISDPRLTTLGVRQAEQLMKNPTVASAFADDQRGRPLLVVSPLRRTMATAWLGFGSKLPYALHSDIQETNPSPCDTGDPSLGMQWLQDTMAEATSRRHLHQLDAGAGAQAAADDETLRGLDDELQSIQSLIDAYLGLPEGWHRKTPDFGERAQVIARFGRFLKWCASRPERCLIVVAHHNVFSIALDQQMANCEAVAYDFEGGQLTECQPPQLTEGRRCVAS